MRRLLLFVFASAALLAAGCGGTSTASLGSDDVAVVGSQEVTKDQFQTLMARAKKSYDTQKRAFPKPGSTEYEQLKGEAIKEQLVSQALFKKVTGDIKVSDADIKAYYASHKTQYVQPESRDVRHILVQKKALADSLYAQLKAGANFAKLAKRYSKDPGSASNGGKLTVSKGQTVAEFDKTAFSLK